MSVEVIFLDVDEVLADWTGAALQLLGYSPARVHAAWDRRDPRPWDMFQVIEMSANQAWRTIHTKGASFWESLQPYPWYRALFQLCESIAPTYLLTSPSLHPSSHAGKAAWLQAHFGRDFRSYLIGGCKHAAARLGAVFPGLGNQHHALRHAPMPFVRDALGEVTR